jgi:hypothetical protein
MSPNPLHLVKIEELAPATVETVIAQIEVSRTADHFVYRESELDALWSLADMAVRRSEPGAVVRQLLWSAHDLVGEGRGHEAVAELRKLIAELERQEAGQPTWARPGASR